MTHWESSGMSNDTDGDVEVVTVKSHHYIRISVTEQKPFHARTPSSLTAPLPHCRRPLPIHLLCVCSSLYAAWQMHADTRAFGMFSYMKVHPGCCSLCGTLGEETGDERMCMWLNSQHQWTWVVVLSVCCIRDTNSSSGQQSRSWKCPMQPQEGASQRPLCAGCRIGKMQRVIRRGRLWNISDANPFFDLHIGTVKDQSHDNPPDKIIDTF